MSDRAATRLVQHGDTTKMRVEATGDAVTVAKPLKPLDERSTSFRSGAEVSETTMKRMSRAHWVSGRRWLAPPTDTLIPLQSWEGVVLSVATDSFVARIVDTSGEHPDEEVEIAIEELSEFDKELLEPGAVFYWVIGYRQRLPRGTRERVSRIRFRRLPAWTRAELSAVQARAEDLQADFGWG